MDPNPPPSPNPNPLIDPQPFQPASPTNQPNNIPNVQTSTPAVDSFAANQTNPASMPVVQPAGDLGGLSNLTSPSTIPDQTPSPTDNVLVGHIPQAQATDLIQPTPQTPPPINYPVSPAISQPVSPPQNIPIPPLPNSVNQPSPPSPIQTPVTVNPSQANPIPPIAAPAGQNQTDDSTVKAKPVKDFKSNLAVAGLIIGVLTVLVEILITSSTLKQIIYIIPLSLTAIGLSAPALGSSRRGYAIGGLVLGSLSLVSIIILYGVSFAVDNRCQSDPNFASSNAQCRPNQPNNPGL